MSSTEEKLRLLRKLFQDAPAEIIEQTFEYNDSDIHETIRLLESMDYSMNYDNLGSPSRSLSADEAALAADMERAIQSSMESDSHRMTSEEDKNLQLAMKLSLEYRVPSEEDEDLQLAKKLSLDLLQTSGQAKLQIFSKEKNLDILNALKAAAGENPHNFCRRFIPVDKRIGGYIAGKKYCHLNRIKDDSTADSIAFVDQSRLAPDVSCFLIEATTDSVADRAEQLLHDHIAKLLPSAVFGGSPAAPSRSSAAVVPAPNVAKVGDAGPARARGLAHECSRTRAAWRAAEGGSGPGRRMSYHISYYILYNII
jgi:hypothetical protein